MNRLEALALAQAIRGAADVACECLSDPNCVGRPLQLEVLFRANRIEESLGRLRAAAMQNDLSARRDLHVLGARPEGDAA
jgi:hypothetical protein